MTKSVICSCGNTDPDRTYFYDGALGYEALICTCCGIYYDNEGSHEPDEFSLQYQHIKCNKS